ncbi:MAG: hypothetical protein Q9159_002233 [Coniocarpon cinnabarinum]
MAKRVGFCGLGAMGMGMATHLISQGYAVKGFDVAPALLKKFQEAGGVPVSALSDSAKGAPVYICMVANSVQAQQALFEADDTIVEALPKGAVLCLCCTVSAGYVKEVQAQLQKIGRGDILLVDCPVSGGAARAAKGDLTIMAGAEPAAIEAARPVLEELTGPNGLYIVEGGLGQGSNMKMCHQVLASVQILATGEAFGVGAKMGLDAHELHARVMESDAWSWMFENRSQRVLKQDYEPPVSALTIIKKDAGIITSQARKTLWPTPMTAATEQVYTSLVMSFGFGPKDDASVVHLYYRDNVADVKCRLSKEEREARLKLVIEMLVAIHIASASEAIMLAAECNIPLKQFFNLVMTSAGASRVFGKFAEAMSGDEGAEPKTGRTMGDCVQSLFSLIDLALANGCPTPMANHALSLFSVFGRRLGEDIDASNLLRTWE